jgi:hypothetical protein
VSCLVCVTITIERTGYIDKDRLPPDSGVPVLAILIVPVELEMRWCA